MNRQVILDALKNGTVKIDFRSLNLVTTRLQFIKDIQQNKDKSNKNRSLGCCELKVIEWDTIISWEKVNEGQSKSKGEKFTKMDS